VLYQYVPREYAIAMVDRGEAACVERCNREKELIDRRGSNAIKISSRRIRVARLLQQTSETLAMKKHKRVRWGVECRIEQP
jgi:hypothetical protein